MKKYSIYLWAFVAVIFVCFIAIMSYWYPVTLDEYARWGKPFNFEILKDSYLNITSRISLLFSAPIFAIGKWFFVIANSLVQLANCLCIFYILFARLPNIQSLKDLPYFIMIACMSIFFVCCPSDVMFWLSGAINYTWSILFLLLMLCYLRQIQAKKNIFKDSLILKICLFIIGFAVGMSNECIAPVAFVFALCFALFYEYKKIKTPRSLSFLIFGLAIGSLVFFSSPVHYNKMVLGGASNISALSFWKKLFFHIYHLNEFFKVQFFIFPLSVLFFIIACLDRNKRNFKQENLWLSLVMLLLSFAMAFILFIVPQPPLRAYYPASVLCIIGFIFLVRYYIEVYGIDFSKWLCYIILLICLIFTPRFILPNYFLHIQEKERNSILETMPNLKVRPYIVLAGPTDNLSIGFMDPARRIHLGDNMYIADMSPVTNW